MGPRADLNDVKEKKFLNTYRDSNSDPSIIQPVAIRYTDYAIPACSICKIGPPKPIARKLTKYNSEFGAGIAQSV
jgi:hypothetical protein